VSRISEEMCRVLRLPESEIEKVKWAGLLHDIGKIGIRDHILLKEGPLDKSERTTMNKHPEIGARIVEPATQLKDEAPLIHAHHEWWNGSGYPRRLETEGIPLGARVLSVADAYEAMTSSRPYRKTPLSHEQAVQQLEKFAGIQFDPDLVPILVNLDREILDPEPESAEEAPTTLHPDVLDRLAEERAAAAASASVTEDDTSASAPAAGTTQGATTTRPALASDDVS
jgi:putative nucleotidyltransferase with HDIG domain